MELEEIMNSALGTLPSKAGRGRKPGPLLAVVDRALTAEEIATACAEEMGIQPIPLKSLRQSHHSLAKLLAQGAKPQAASAILGISPSRISILQADPQFAELLAYYAGMEKAAWADARADMAERLSAIGFDSLEVLAERLEEDPDQFSNKELLSMVEASADRTGHGKTIKGELNVTNNVGAETLAAIRSASENRAPVAEEDRRALVSLARAATQPHPGTQEAPWIEGEGTLVREESPGDARGVGP